MKNRMNFLVAIYGHSYCFESSQITLYYGLLHSVSRAFLLLARFWRSRERLCMNRVRSLLSMCCMLPGYSLEPKPNMQDLAAIWVFHGTAGSIVTIGFIPKRMLALEKPVKREKTRCTGPEVRA